MSSVPSPLLKSAPAYPLLLLIYFAFSSSMSGIDAMGNNVEAQGRRSKKFGFPVQNVVNLSEFRPQYAE